MTKRQTHEMQHMLRNPPTRATTIDLVTTHHVNKVQLRAIK
jgi:hypothetical protein